MKHLLLTVATVVIVFLFTSCESCVRKTSQKITELGITAIEGASDALNEHGEKVGEKAVGAVGNVAKGMGKGLERFIKDYEFGEAYGENDYIVQSSDEINLESLENDFEEINYSASLPENVSIEYMGEFKENGSITTVFTIEKEGEYTSIIQFVDSKNKILLEKKIAINKEAEDGKYTGVIFALNPSDTEKYNQSKKTKISMSKK